jgi:putative peptidoglycan lipid II flippase
MNGFSVDRTTEFSTDGTKTVEVPTMSGKISAPGVEKDVHAGARSAVGLTLLTAFSPLTGFVMEMVLAWRFGASAITDGYRVAYLLSGFAWTLFIAQVLPNVVVPIHAELDAQSREIDAWRLSFALANVSLLITSVVCLIVFIWPSPLASTLGPGLQGQARSTAILLVRWFSVAYIPLVWSGIAIGILYTQRVFWVATVASSVGNVLMLTVVAGLGGRWGVWSLVVGTLGGSILTLAICAIRIAPLLSRIGIGCVFSFRLSDLGVRAIGVLALPLLVSVLISQLTGIISNRLLSPMPVGTVATFGYAWKMGILATMLPLSLSTVLFPRFAHAWHSTNQNVFGEVCTRALRTTLFLAVPVAAVLYILRIPLVSLMFQHGAFSADAVRRVSIFLGYTMLLGALPNSLTACIQKILCATRTMWLSTYGQMAGLALFAVAGGWTARHYGAVGVLVLYMITIWISLGIMFFILIRALRSINFVSIVALATELIAIMGASAAVEHLLTQSWLHLSANGFSGLLLVLSARVTLLTLFFGGLALIVRVPEADEGLAYLRWQIRSLWHSGFSVPSARVVAETE